MLSAANISYNAGKKNILRDVTARFLPGEFTMILGPNGSGKSTFLKIFSGEIQSFGGSVNYENKNLHNIKKEELATYRAVMSQQPELSFPLTVEEVVMMGRYPHFTFNPSKKDLDICHAALELLSLSDFKHRDYTTLSGGEKQRVQFARVLSQIWEPPVSGKHYLFLDEPLNNLDIRFQHDFLKTALQFKDRHTILVAVMHDINLAAQYGDSLLFMNKGTVKVQGRPDEVLTAPLIREIFEVDVTVSVHPVHGSPVLLHN